jgi:L-aminopeptidase/D-esterase-like protein
MVGALAVVNALGDVLDGSGRIVAGARSASGAFLDASRMLREGAPELRARNAPRAGQNTTLAVVATNAPLGKVDLLRLGRIAATALPRRISPVHTPFDGDVVFSASAAPAERALTDVEVLMLGVAARDALEEAITGAVR